MRKKMVLLTLAAAMVLSMGLTGCATNPDNVTTRGAKNNMRTRTAQDGMYPLGMNPNLDTNANGFNGQRYGVNGTRGNGLDGLGTRGNGLDGLGTRGNGLDGIGTRGNGLDGIGTRGNGLDGFGTRGTTRGTGMNGLGRNGFGINDDLNGLGTNGNRFGMNGLGTNGNRFGMNGFGTYGYGMNGFGTYGTGNYGMNNFTGYGVDGNRLNGNGTGYGNAHTMTNMQMSKKIADKIARMKGVKTANVMLTNNNAYVAVTTDTQVNAKGTTRGNGMNKSMGRAGGTGNLDARSKSHALNNSADMSGNGVSSDLKGRIAQIVKKDAPQCDQVYVSANPDFVQRMNQFMKSSAEGRPLSGFANEFQEMVYRIFPTQEYGTTRQMTNTHPRRLNNMAPGLR
ncbi:YhcN/YlaJ family sporulation lipoprotein [Paenibacillus dendritiformis]|uniref:YhcN/YlaJ family sporulation lipoprotein n=1 Tax=Paenibacillus dendritiformis TaxID=130049 RepID=UPI00140C6849|nr:YhcN/YlaJ family sporulation lipoprotein [Paenibacillus dendritiformis]